MAGSSPADEQRAEERIGPAQIEGQATRTAAAYPGSLPQTPLWNPAQAQRAAAPERRPRRTPCLGAGSCFLDALRRAYAAPCWPSNPLAMVQAPPQAFPRRQLAAAALDKARLRCVAFRRTPPCPPAAHGALPPGAAHAQLLSTSASARRRLALAPVRGGGA